MTVFKQGARVIDVRADDPDAIPAMKTMFGKVFQHSWYTVWVYWDVDGPPVEPRAHHVSCVRLLSREEETRRIAEHNALQRDKAIAEVQRRYDAACADNKLFSIKF